MKRLISLFVAIMLLATPLSINANDINYGTSEVVSRMVEVLDDGSVLETVIYVENSNNSTFATKTITGTKEKTLKDSDGKVQWTFTLRGTFSVNMGVSATCTSSVYTTSDLASGWELEFGNASKSGNKAMADYIFKHKVLFITTQTVEGSLTLTCSANGTLS